MPYLIVYRVLHISLRIAWNVKFFSSSRCYYCCCCCFLIALLASASALRWPRPCPGMPTYAWHVLKRTQSSTHTQLQIHSLAHTHYVHYCCFFFRAAKNCYCAIDFCLHSENMKLKGSNCDTDKHTHTERDTDTHVREWTWICVCLCEAFCFETKVGRAECWELWVSWMQ